MDRSKLLLAKQILLTIFITFIFAAIARIFVPGEGADAVWDCVTYVLPPLATLIIGFYFGNKNHSD